MLSGCIFDIHQPDKDEVVARLQREGKTPEAIAAMPAKFFNSSCRRTIPDKDIVGPRLQSLMEHFRDAGDIEGQPLLTPATWRVHEQQMRLVDKNLLAGLFSISKSCTFDVASMFGIS